MTDSPTTAVRPLEGQVALVTGASRGIGRAIAERLAEAGARVACVATSEANVTATAEACAAHQEGAKAFGVDVSDTKAVEGLVKSVSSEFGGIDILVNNAGITRDQLLMRMSEDEFDRVISVNLKGSWNFVKAAARPLMKAGAGRIINIASVVGVTGNAGQANYAASKAGVIGLTKSAAKELSGRGVTVNAIAPGFIETDMTAEIPDNEKAKLTGAIPLGRMGSSEEIASAALFLAGPTGAYITGQTLIVDGGLSL
ncbi:MAG: 3-oxoacyl-[acyl-carrier-protein] reductase [Planctomycetota bacterium]